MKPWTPEELAERRAAFDVEADRIAEAIEMGEISLNAITGEAMRAHGMGAPIGVFVRKSARVPAHGTLSEYDRHKCRCDECKAVKRTRNAAAKEKYHEARKTAKRRQKFIDRIRYIHGRECKCPECVRWEVTA